MNIHTWFVFAYLHDEDLEEANEGEKLKESSSRDLTDSVESSGHVSELVSCLFCFVSKDRNRIMNVRIYTQNKKEDCVTRNTQ